MARILVLYYSSYGHIETMAMAVADGARQTGATADVKRVPELVPDAVASKSGYKVDQQAPVAMVSQTPCSKRLAPSIGISPENTSASG